MAVRQEDLLVREAVVYRFPTAAIARRRAREEVVRRRRVAASVVAVVLSAGLLAAWSPEGGPVLDTSGAQRIQVAPGETLWDIAEAHAPASADLRAYVDQIQELNGLKGSIRPGMHLKLPR